MAGSVEAAAEGNTTVAWSTAGGNVAVAVAGAMAVAVAGTMAAAAGAAVLGSCSCLRHLFGGAITASSVTASDCS